MENKGRAVARKTKGFTLIEMLIVMSIIAILMAATIPAVISASCCKKVTDYAANITREGAVNDAASSTSPSALYLQEQALKSNASTTAPLAQVGSPS
jgi:prepilin-type N-terminal cleavage/methylation domain-containing protein